MATAKKVPGPGEHSPDFKNLKSKAPSFGFGSDKRNNKDIERNKYIPGAGTYTLPDRTGAEGRKSTIHSTINYSPEKRENSYKPGPGNYSPDRGHSMKKEPQYKIGTGKRLDLEAE